MVVVTSAYESDQAGAKKLFVQAKNRISDRLGESELFPLKGRQNQLKDQLY